MGGGRIDVEYASGVMDKCMKVLLKYHITENHIAEIFKATAILHRFPYAKAIECALLDDDLKICYYTKEHSCMFDNSSPIEIDKFDKQLQQGYNRTKTRLFHFIDDIRDIAKMDEVYKTLSFAQINQEENTHFSDSFVKHIKYRLLDARFISDGTHVFGIADWAFRDKSADVYYVQNASADYPACNLYVNRILDSYLDEIGEVEITIDQAAKVLLDKGVVLGNDAPCEEKERRRYIREYLSSNRMGACAYVRNRHWYIHRSNVFWPPC